MSMRQIDARPRCTNPARLHPWRLAFTGLAMLALAACGGDGGTAVAPATTTTPVATAPARVSLTVSAFDNASGFVPGASVSVSAGTESTRTATTDGKGEATFADLPTGPARVSIRAEGFDPIDSSTNLFPEPTGRNTRQFFLRATLGWTLGPPAVLGADVENVSADGSSARVTLDVAVLRNGTSPLETLTAADFEVLQLDCGEWAAYLQCATDASGQPTSGSGRYRAEGAASSFALLGPAPRSSYATGFLAELGSETLDWTRSRPFLKGFFEALRPPDAASLATFYVDGTTTSGATLGPLTSDGTAYATALDRIDARSGARANPRSAIEDFVRTTLSSSAGRAPTAVTHLVIYGQNYVYMDGTDRAATLRLLRDHGLRFSVIAGSQEGAYGVLDLVARTRGLIVEVTDVRQLTTLAPALDGLLAGTTPRFRMTFLLKGAAGTFVSGGTIGGLLRIRVPDFKPAHALYTSFAAAIP